MQRILVLVVLAVIGGIYLGVSKNSDDARARDEAVGAPTPAPPVPNPDRPPTFSVRGTNQDASRANAAMRAVYAKCSAYAVFREGSKIDADYVEGQHWSNVRVELARPEVASGNTLWYQVGFVGDVPRTITPTKDEAARLCHLGARNVAGLL